MWFAFTASRLFNWCLLNISYLLSCLTGSVFVWGFPFTLSVETSGKCQLSCPECPIGIAQNHAGKLLSPELFQKIIAQTHKHLLYMSLYFQGEAFLNPNIYDFIKRARSKRIYTSISTNGNITDERWVEKLVDSGLNEIIISLDGTNSDSYNLYRVGGDFQLLIRQLNRLSSLLKTMPNVKLKVIIQFLIMRHNENEIPIVREMTKQWGFSLRLKTIQLMNPENENSFLPRKEVYRRYKKIGTHFVLKNPLKNHCYRLYKNPVITSLGEVRPCCFDKSGSYPMGNLNETDFKDIWKSKDYMLFRKRVFNQRKNIDICCNCTEGTKNVYV
jgi:radical SAM protein with 4Fe4S-binding SPASM domain